MKYAANSELTNELSGLPTLTRSELLERWHKLYKSPPPFKISNELLIMSVAYKMQENIYGGLKPATGKYLLTVAEDLRAGKKIAERPLFKPGTRLLREWKGITHEVTILEKGVLYKKQIYRSLSEVAKLITGVNWSGPLFFGLKSKKTSRHELA